MQTLSAAWNFPTAIRVGENTAKNVAAECQRLGMASPMLVTDPGLAAMPMVQELIHLCEQAGLKVALFSDIKSNPSGENVELGVQRFKQGQHDSVIAFGGGSALDAGKAIAFMAGQTLPLWAFEDIGDNWSKADSAAIKPLIAIPTTAGTGSEVGRSSVITDTQNKVKKIIFHPGMTPKLVLLDPVVCVGLPPALTAATGMDALSHNLEAFCAPFYHPLAEGIAIEGIRLVKEHLLQAYTNGGDVHARTQMLVASAMGATAFQRGLGGMHAIAHSLGALYDAHHGLLNAILMPYVLQANRSVIEERITRLSRYLDLAPASFSAFLNWVLEMRSQLSIPHSLMEIGIDGTQAELVAAMSVKDPSAGGNPIAFSQAEYQRIFLAAVDGKV